MAILDLNCGIEEFDRTLNECIQVAQPTDAELFDMFNVETNPAALAGKWFYIDKPLVKERKPMRNDKVAQISHRGQRYEVNIKRGLDEGKDLARVLAVSPDFSKCPHMAGSKERIEWLRRHYEQFGEYQSLFEDPPVVEDIF